ncbi:hypothetical protein H8356DRAFT_1668445 [Neocallimastix lanati (nom. inval.)]|jgi:hypothetical protein|uniref:Endoplasmic reticulum junction formation protein lunapark n=1 Tax=Neocallimastix californiae TaxID=1754190 RepID=A0A1Y2EVH0_9FUNG|nr:hypothetical protein H8356DRAFT_1668445 [Neocallimastix sp. JGI-2020a]ORY75560.1 hypothetical protein LY90DRAFT_665859 [Neocallimastix californiae]|eukprot:ORY75560.1 hypothetical protein LY90DRAFT_665859 [Neocallimastix californiae]
MFWRRRSSTKEKDYEKLLADIDLEIRKIEDKLRQIKIREDRSIITWLYYSIPVYSFILIGYCFYLYQSYNPWPVLFIQAFPLLVGLFLIIFIKKFISIWYKKKQMKEEDRRDELKQNQREILDELKSKIKYYETKNLIEKYELQEPEYPMNNNGIQRMHPQMNINNQKISPNQIRNQQMMLSRKQQLIGGHNLSKQRSMPVVSQNRKQQFTDMRYNQQFNQYNQQYTPQYGAQSQGNPNERNWIDKLMDAIVGDVNEVDKKYALVCNYCYIHCGLALPEEYKTFKYICPNCKKLNDNAKKYNIKDPKSDQKTVDEDHMLLPPSSAPIEKQQYLGLPPVNIQSKSEPVTPQKSNFIISNDGNDNKKPNLERRSSTLLDEMDDSTNTDTTTINQSQSIPVNIKSEDITNEETDESLDQDLKGNINKFENEFEQGKEVINYQEENDMNNINNSFNTMVEEGDKIENDEIKESIIQDEIASNNETIDESKQDVLITSLVKEQNDIVRKQ